MIIQFIDEDALINLKENIPQLLSNFRLDSNKWIDKFLGRNPFVDTNFQNIPDFQLSQSEEKPFMTESKNVRLIYGNLNFLTNSQASDERLWAGLALGEFWDYVQYRWKIKKKCTADNILQHYFFNYSVRRSLTRNAIARLWWIGRLTYNPKSATPYKLTDYVCEHPDIIMHTLERNTSNNPIIIRAFLNAIMDAETGEQLNINTDIVGELAKYLNLLGGTYILDCLPENLIYEKILNKIQEIAKQAQ
jgi:hypothetical protein